MTMTIDAPLLDRPALSRRYYSYVLILALFVGSLTIAASGPTLDALSAQLGSDTPFAPPAVQITFLRVTAGAWAVLFSLLQAVVLGLLLASIGRAARPRVLLSWFWVLIGQIPFLATVALTQVVAGSSGMASISGLGLRIGFGAVGVAIYALCAQHTLHLDARRLVLFAGVAILLNSAFLLLSR